VKTDSILVVGREQSVEIRTGTLHLAVTSELREATALAEYKVIPR